MIQAISRGFGKNPRPWENTLLKMHCAICVELNYLKNKTYGGVYFISRLNWKILNILEEKYQIYPNETVKPHIGPTAGQRHAFARLYITVTFLQCLQTCWYAMWLFSACQGNNKNRIANTATLVMSTLENSFILWSIQVQLRNLPHPSKHETFSLCWSDVGPPSATLDQHQTNVLHGNREI